MNAYDLTGDAYHHTVTDVDSLHTLAKLLPPDPIIVNIGACFGTSALAMLEVRPDAFIFSIDVAECPAERENISQAGLVTRRVIRVLGRSQDIGLAWPGKVDMVFVDGQHDYQAVLDDINNWRDNIVAGGMMAFHDYDKTICPEVKPAVDEAMAGLSLLLTAESIRAYWL